MLPPNYEPIVDQDIIRRHLPKLIEGVNFHFTSEETDQYNCVNWALGINTSPKYLFQEDGTEDISLKGFIEYYKSLGFEITDDISVEKGVTKIALYADDGIFVHVARLLDTGMWTSKLGTWEDICHISLDVLAGKFYGIPQVYMKK